MGIDPGKSKTGLALVTGQGEILTTEVVLMSNFSEALKGFLGAYKVHLCVLGNGTTSRALQEVLRGQLPQLVLKVVDEAHSTEEARLLYWQLNPPKGLRKFFPLGMQLPPQNLDGLAAAVLVRRYLAQGPLAK